MGILKWYKRDPRSALTGMMELTLEERGAYNTVLDLIYAHDGKIADDPKIICPWLGVNGRTWKRLRSRLIDREKLYPHAGYLHNQRADGEVLEALHRVETLTEAANKRWATYREIKGLDRAKAITPTTTPTNLSYLVPKLKK